MPGKAVTGSEIYSKPVLAAYDWFVLGFSNRWLWRCPTTSILDLYDRYVSANHLEVGVGTGYFLDRCRFPTSRPRLALVDLNPNSLDTSAARLARYRPDTQVANILEPFTLSPAFDSIGINYVLHCLPGSMPGKGVVFGRLKTMLNDGGVVFGATLLGDAVPSGRMAAKLMAIYNAKGIFSNVRDNLGDLERNLAENFSNFDLWMTGCAAFFVGRK